MKEHPQPNWFDHIAEYADAFAETSLHVKPFAYTQDERRRMQAQSSGLLRTILRELIPLGGDEQVWHALKRDESWRR